VLKKIRRTLMLQGLLWGLAVWFGWKNRDALERSIRAARAAWNEVGGDAAPVDEIVVITAAPEAASW
jgi:hypothetical protein